jgi:hypothetical protein
MSSANGVLGTPPPYVFVDRLDGDNFSLTCGVWATPADISTVQRGVIGEALRGLEASGVEALSPSHIVRNRSTGHRSFQIHDIAQVGVPVGIATSKAPRLRAGVHHGSLH